MDQSDNKLTRRDLLMTIGASVLALGLINACGPSVPAALVATTAGDTTGEMASSEESFREFLVEFEEGTSRFVNGDPALWKHNASQQGDATIMGAWGAYEQGWDEVSARYDWAAARFLPSGARVQVEYLAFAVSGDLAYTVANERCEPQVVGQAGTVPMALRVTHIFRREAGEWKLLHRHADPLMEKTAPAAVLKQ